MHKQLRDQNFRVLALCLGLVRMTLRGVSEKAVSAHGNAGDPMKLPITIIEINVGRRDEDTSKSFHKDGCCHW